MARSESSPRSAFRARPAAAADEAARSDAPAEVRPVLVALAALAAARAVMALLPGTWGWSLQLLRFVAPLPGWTLWALATLALLPAAAAFAAPSLAAASGAIERHPMRVAIPVALAVGTLVAWLTDRTWFVGDFLLRAGAVDSGRDFARIAPQSLPLDVLLHIAWPRALAAAGWLAHPSDAARGIGALEAAALAALLIGAGGEWVRGGAARVTFAALALGGAGLGLFAGYGKTSGEMILLTVATAALAPRLAREGRGAAALGVTLAVALVTHRSALLLVPAWAAAWAVAFRTRRVKITPATLAFGLALPLAALVAFAPKLVGLLAGFDLGRHLMSSAPGGRPWWRAALDPIGWLDRINVALAYAPLAPLLPALAWAGRGRATAETDRGRRVVALALALPAAAMLLLVRPQQGLLRDWDVFAIPGTLLACATAAAISRAASRSATRLAAPLVACALVSGGLVLMNAHDTARGLARVRAFALESPRRDDAERGKLWEFLGDRAASLARWDDAAEALGHAVNTQPSPRLFSMLAMAEEARGHLEGAEAAWRLAVARDPADTTAWSRLIEAALRRGDHAVARAAAESLERRSPAHPLVRHVLSTP